jgi:hypothetical protein
MTTLLHMHGPRTRPIQVFASPVWRRPVTFSLGHALLANGLLPPLPKGGKGLSLRLSTRARRVWKLKLEAMLKDAEAAGVLDRDRLERAEAPQGTLIGWKPTDISAMRREFDICDDLTLTLLVLERRVGDLYVSSRPPNRTWRHLFERALTVDDPRFTGVPLSEELPWRPERSEFAVPPSGCVDVSLGVARGVGGP